MRNPDYRLLFWGLVGSANGWQMLTLARGYLAYDLTGSAAILGFVTIATGLPMAVLSLFGGVIADRIQRRFLLLATQWSTVVLCLLTAVLVQTGAIEIWHLVVIGIVQGSVFALNIPVRQAYMLELIDKEELPNAIALFNSANTCVRIIAPAILGVLLSIEFIGMAYTFYFVTLSYLIPVIQIMRIHKAPKLVARPRTNVMTDFWEGVRYMMGHPIIRLLLLAGLVPAIFGNAYQQILPVIAGEDGLDVGKSGFSMLAFAAGFGALIGSLLVASMKQSGKQGLYQVLAGGGLGLALIWFGLMNQLLPALVALVAVGFSSSLYQTLNTTQAMSVADEAFYGRVGSTQQVSYNMLSILFPAIGVIVDEFGPQPFLVASGIFVAVFWVLMAVFVPSFRKRESTTHVYAAAKS